MPGLSSAVLRPATFLVGVGKELVGASRHASDCRSLLRLAGDIVLYRVLRLAPALASSSRRRTVNLDGASITYRLNRGDIQGIREVWLQQAYTLPPGLAPRTVLDLGANIGLTSVWLATTYGCEYVVGVEPDPRNAALARLNMEANGVDGHVIEAAVGPTDGTVRFTTATDSNLGSTVVARDAEPASIEVTMRSPQSIMREAGLARVDLCKLDVEGAEGPTLLEGDTSWLARVGSVIAELHADMIDAPAVAGVIEAAGLRHRRRGIDGVKLEFFGCD